MLIVPQLTTSTIGKLRGGLSSLSPARQKAAIAIVYTVFIIGVLVWSGTVRDQTLYDIYTTKVEGTAIPVTDLSRSITFYRSIVNFSPVTIDAQSTYPTFRLPGNKQLYLMERKQSAVADILQAAVPNYTTLVIRVKDNIQKLHRDLVQRNHSPEISVNGGDLALATLAPTSVSALMDREWGHEFLLTDPDGNRFLFVQGRSLRTDPYKGDTLLRSQ